MNRTITFPFQGLEVTAEISPYDKGTWMEPPSGGEVEDYTFVVDDLDEVLAWGDLVESESVERMLMALFGFTGGTVPQILLDKIGRVWDDEIILAAYEYVMESY